MKRLRTAPWRARKLTMLCVALTAATLLAGPSAVAEVPSVRAVSTPSVLADYPGMGFYAAKQGASQDQQRQVEAVRRTGNFALAARLNAMNSTPTATWLVNGSPAAITAQVQGTTTAAAAKNQLPVFVAYNLPFLDCSQGSGGAASPAAYRAWIDALVAGIGSRAALVVLEPDGLAIIPWHTNWRGTMDSCKPGNAAPATAATDRYALMNYAVDKLSALPRASVYLDGGHSGWHDVGDTASRLVKAGVQKSDGFFLNVSNFESTEREVRYGSWVSKCIHYATNPADGGKRLGRYTDCAGQYSPASSGDVRTWGRTDAWYAANVDSAAGAPTASRPLEHFVVDTSRNGKGAWTPRSGTYPDAQTWCNPPGRGIGYKPTTATGHPLVDAFLWIKVPGESDGQCSRGLGAGVVDPAWGRVNPSAGLWFPEQALSLLKNAGPAVRR